MKISSSLTRRETTALGLMIDLASMAVEDGEDSDGSTNTAYSANMRIARRTLDKLIKALARAEEKAK